MKKSLIILLLTLSIFTITSCSKNEQMAINIPTASTTGALYPLGFSIADLWSEKAGVKATAQASNGGVDNLNLVYDGDAQVSLGVSSIVYQSYHGEGVFEGRENKKLRIIAGLYLNPNQIVVRSDSGINSISDLKGKNFSAGAPGSTTEGETNLHLEAYKIPIEDVNIQRVAPAESADMMRNKKLDGVWIMAAAPTASVTEMTSSMDAKLLSVDQEIIDVLNKNKPWYASYIIPAGTYRNQTEDINTSAIKMVLYTTTDIPEETVYNMTKVFWENIDMLKEKNKGLKDVTVKEAVNDIANLPIADGAAKYYREIGVME
ncbi:TAXI family TRAP transporter solute-binding subunit [Peptoniphilus sp. oral taxon 386]|uniref:TAXI family TRAP transporter solute-binding subunit n=1 Tax=Peptoniphilus sp. oral taxon 386 TaxID=652713 RepID=UPI0001DA99E7|nr:TAXI family TRAP transporter solute-binding subunit [Peptoniphilus sp. oral taxon 386]EFI41793.1 TRAP transporter solute receptor, TAXI family [Peptoniphilus sp. oral taxon 386 str. F0131]